MATQKGKTRSRKARPAPPRTPPTNWLVMLYFAGDNNLDEEMVLSLQDIVAAGVPAGDKIVVQFDPGGAGVHSQRYDFSDSMGKKTLEDFRVPFQQNETNTGNPAALVDFADWAIRTHLDNGMQILLVLSGHGSGSTQDFLLKDDNALDSLSIPELRDAVRAIRTAAGRKIDVLGFDACFMSMGEVAAEVSEWVNILVGSEGEEPGFGWPYRRLLEATQRGRATRGRPATASELATMIVRSYVDFYAAFDRAAGRSVDLAAIDLRKIDEVVDGVAQLTTALLALGKGDHNRVLLAHWYAQTFKFEQFVDLYDLADQLSRQFTTGPVNKACKAIRAAVRRCVLLSGCSGYAHQHSHGLSIYFPWALLAPTYSTLRFAYSTDWPKFVQKHICATRREQRHTTPPVPCPPAPPRHRDTLVTHLLSSGDVPVNVVADLAPAVTGEPTVPADAITETVSRALALQRKIVSRAESAAARATTSDIPPEDVDREATMMFSLAGSVSGAGARKDRYTPRTKFTPRTRFTNDREFSVKNLPPALGVTFEP